MTYKNSEDARCEERKKESELEKLGCSCFVNTTGSVRGRQLS